MPRETTHFHRRVKMVERSHQGEERVQRIEMRTERVAATAEVVGRLKVMLREQRTGSPKVEAGGRERGRDARLFCGKEHRRPYTHLGSL